MATTTEIYRILVETTGATQETLDLLKAQTALNNSLRATQKTAASTGASLNTLANETKRAESAVRNQALSIQNAGFQVQDFAVQVAGGTSAMRAFSQQAPQFLTAFGVGSGPFALIIAGAATLIALLPLLADYFLSTGKEVEALAESTKTLSDTFNTYKSLLNDAITIEEQYTAALRDGNQAQADRLAVVAEATAAQAAIVLAQLKEDQVNLIRTQEQALLAVAAAQQEVTRSAEFYNRTLAQGDFNAIEIARIGLADTVKLWADAANGANAAAAEARLVEAQIAAAEQSTESLTQKIKDVANGTAEARVNAEDAAAAFEAARAAASGLPAVLTAAANAAATLATNAWNAARALLATRQAQFRASSLNYSMQGGMDGATAAAREYQGELALLSQALEENKGASDAAAAATGGAAGATDELAASEALMADVIERVNETLRIQKAELEKVKPAMDILSTGVTGAFDAMIDGAASWQQALRDALLQILRDIEKFLLSQQINNLLKLFAQTSFGGSILGVASGQPVSAGIQSNTMSSYSTGVGSLSTMEVPSNYSASPSEVRNAMGGGAGGLKVEINNTVSDSTDVQVRESNSGGMRVLEVTMLRKVKEAFANGSMDKTMSAAYGVRRRPG
jgi:hypothetical protein